MSLGKYGKYKDSGIKWLGAVPEQWEIKRAKQIFFEIGDVKTTGKEMLLTVSHITGVTPRSEKNVNMFLAESMEGYKRVIEGDLIINTMWAWMGALGISNYNGICSPAYNIYRQRKKVNSNPKYFGYLFSTRNFVVEMTRRSKGIVESRLRLYPRDFYRIEICFPSGLEQTQIANYLDSKTQAIDKKVELLKQKTDKYKELRKSLIHQTITKGLNPNTEFKDSEVEWIGEIPKHWEVKRLKDISRFYNGYAFNSNDYIENGISIIRIGNIQDKIDESQTKKVDNHFLAIAKEAMIKRNDILIAMTGATIGKSSIFNEDSKMLLNQRVGMVRCSNVLSAFLYYHIQAEKFLKYIQILCGGSAQENISKTQIENYQIQFPPLNEQKEIAQFLDTKTNLIDGIIANIEKQIAGLAELRKTLINDVVTGRLKVNEES